MAPQPAFSGSIKVLHRSCEGSPSSSPRIPTFPEVAHLQEQADGLKQQITTLEQAKSRMAADRKRATEEARQEREQRQAAEQRIRRLLREADTASAARRRLEAAFGRAMDELKHSRANYMQSQSTIQLLLTELAKARRNLASTVSSGGSSGSSSSSAPTRGRSASGNTSTAGAAGAGSRRNTACSASRLGRESPVAEVSTEEVEGLMCELSAARDAAIAAESSNAALQHKISVLAEEKERAEMSQDMVSRQTQALLEDRQQLVRALESKDEAVRQLEAEADNLRHQLDLALSDRELLLSQLERVGGQAAVAELSWSLGEDLEPSADEVAGLAAGLQEFASVSREPSDSDGPDA